MTRESSSPAAEVRVERLGLSAHLRSRGTLAADPRRHRTPRGDARAFCELPPRSDRRSSFPFHQLERRAYEWRLITSAQADIVNPRKCECIRNVPAVPAQQIV